MAKKIPAPVQEFSRQDIADAAASLRAAADGLDEVLVDLGGSSPDFDSVPERLHDLQTGIEQVGCDLADIGAELDALSDSMSRWLPAPDPEPNRPGGDPAPAGC
jgi:hypothetical protein